MKNRLLKSIAALIFGLTMSYTASVFAHSQRETLGTAEGATDAYIIGCSTDGGGVTDHLLMRVRTGTANAKIKVSARTMVLLSPTLLKATNTTDLANGDISFSPEVRTVGGNNYYYVTVGKTAASTVPVVYDLDFHCESKTGIHTGTADPYPLQDQ